METENIKFKVGDRIRMKTDCSGCLMGEIYTLTLGSRTGDGLDTLWATIGKLIPDTGGCNCQSNWELIKTNNKNIMQNLTSMLKRLLDADSQVLYKAGFINGNLELTEKGKEELLGISFDAYKELLVDKAKEQIAEEEKEK